MSSKPLDTPRQPPQDPGHAEPVLGRASEQGGGHSRDQPPPPSPAHLPCGKLVDRNPDLGSQGGEEGLSLVGQRA